MWRMLAFSCVSLEKAAVANVFFCYSCAIQLRENSVAKYDSETVVETVSIIHHLFNDICIQTCIRDR